MAFSPKADREHEGMDVLSSPMIPNKHPQHDLLRPLLGTRDEYGASGGGGGLGCWILVGWDLWSRIAGRFV